MRGEAAIQHSKKLAIPLVGFPALASLFLHTDVSLALSFCLSSVLPYMQKSELQLKEGLAQWMNIGTSQQSETPGEEGGSHSESQW